MLRRPVEDPPFVTAAGSSFQGPRLDRARDPLLGAAFPHRQAGATVRGCIRARNSSLRHRHGPRFVPDADKLENARRAAELIAQKTARLKREAWKMRVERAKQKAIREKSI